MLIIILLRCDSAAAASTVATPSGGINNNVNGSRCYSTTSLPRAAVRTRQYYGMLTVL